MSYNGSINAASNSTVSNGIRRYATGLNGKKYFTIETVRRTLFELSGLKGEYLSSSVHKAYEDNKHIIPKKTEKKF
ncbi:MAG: hypothetical protein KAS04_02860 [Candidatus Aenigmarchaeota archaeon]|nr:hypothetical protein [Candidatus Aenigmarchaeota archaeon]